MKTQTKFKPEMPYEGERAKQAHDRQMITLSKGGTGEQRVTLAQAGALIPDVWKLTAGYHEQIREPLVKCWHLAHDFHREIWERNEKIETLRAACTAALVALTEDLKGLTVERMTTQEISRHENLKEQLKRALI